MAPVDSMMGVGMGFRRASPFVKSALELESETRLWILRLLVHLGGYRELIGAAGYRDDALAHALGLPDAETVDFEAFSPKDVLALLEDDLARTDADVAVRAEAPLRRNIERLSDLVGLSPVDRELLAFGVRMSNDLALKEVAGWMGSLPSAKLITVLSVALEIPDKAIRQALSPQGVLHRSGLLQFAWSNDTGLEEAMEVLSPRFAQLIAAEDAEPLSFLSGTARTTSPATLALADYPYLAESLRVLVPYLRESRASGRPGVNVLLHGVPGTGKTQLAKILAGEAGGTLFEVASEDGDGDPISGERRLRAYSLAQNLVPTRSSMILFDEVEDVFGESRSDGWRRGSAQARKAWMNRVLEENRVPALWLANEIDALDPAFLRRFDMVIEVPVPPRRERERLLKERYADLIDDRRASQLAQSGDLAPALISRAADTVRFIKERVDPGMVGDAFQLLIDGALRAQGHAPTRKSEGVGLPATYDPAFIRASADLAAVAQGLGRTMSGRLCLYGPPGTGKTAYGQWVAESLGLPCHVQRASDFLSKWVGDSERNVAKAFAAATREGAVLLIDEVDSFLRDRRRSEYAWETTLVNEMLTQMEAFNGILIATTNLAEVVDTAALRRFDLKVKFDYLAGGQAAQLLARHCAALGLPAPGADEDRRVRALTRLTPGDFAAVSRQHRFQPVASPAGLVEALEAECALKGEAKRPIGFIH